MLPFQSAKTLLGPRFRFISHFLSPISFHSQPLNPNHHHLRRSSGTSNNHFIQFLCQKGNLKEAIQLLSQESNPSVQTYELLILSCSLKNSLIDAEAVHRQLTYNGFEQNPFIATKLINMYSELGSLELAREVFDKILNRTIYVWNALFKALTLAGYGDEVLYLYHRMNEVGTSSDSYTYTYVLKACITEESAVVLLDKGKEIHAHILRHGYESHVHVMTTLLDMYAKFGCVSDACLVFAQMPVKNLVSWSAIIACCSKNGMPFQALELFREMMLETHELLPNSVTMISVIQACTAVAALVQGKLLHGYVLRKSLDSISPVVSALVTMYARCGDLELGRRVFDQMVSRDVVSWNSMISSYGIHGFGRKAIQVFREMLGRGIQPSHVSFVSVLGACSHEGLVEEGKNLFESMLREHKMYPNGKHYACMVDLLGRANQLDEAAKVIEDMRIEPGPTVWGALLGSCRIHCNIELAERASRRLFELEPENAGNYVLMAEIYAKAEMWDEVKRIKVLLDAQGVQKLSGCSWIEVKRKIYSFMLHDELKPQNGYIHAFLLKLSTAIKKKGYLPQTKVVLYDIDEEEKESILLGHSAKMALAFGLINSNRHEVIRITNNLRLCEDCHSFIKLISKYTNREVLVRDVNRIHQFRDGVCSCGDYW